jgi:hypothetical protein
LDPEDCKTLQNPVKTAHGMVVACVILKTNWQAAGSELKENKRKI